MATLSVNQARRILGKDVNGASDVDVESIIETATLLRDIFFNQLSKSRCGVDKDSLKCHNMEVYGEESGNLHKSI